VPGESLRVPGEALVAYFGGLIGRSVGRSVGRSSSSSRAWGRFEPESAVGRPHRGDVLPQLLSRRINPELQKSGGDARRIRSDRCLQNGGSRGLGRAGGRRWPLPRNRRAPDGRRSRAGCPRRCPTRDRIQRMSFTSNGRGSRPMAARFVQWPRPCPIAVGSSSDRPIRSSDRGWLPVRPTASVPRGQSGQFRQRPPSILRGRGQISR
jgi:hypothetical protein